MDNDKTAVKFGTLGGVFTPCVLTILGVITAVVFIQFDPPAPEQESEFLEWTKKNGKLVPDIIYVHSAQSVSLEAYRAA